MCPVPRRESRRRKHTNTTSTRPINFADDLDVSPWQTFAKDVNKRDGENPSDEADGKTGRAQRSRVLPVFYCHHCCPCDPFLCLDDGIYIYIYYSTTPTTTAVTEDPAKTRKINKGLEKEIK